MTHVIDILRENFKQKKGGLKVVDTITKKDNNNLIAIIESNNNNKTKYVLNDKNSNKYNFDIDETKGKIISHIPLGLERYIILLTGASRMGKTALASIYINQTIKNITKKVFYISSKNYKDDINLKNIKIKQIQSEDIEDMDIENNFNNSLLVFDDVDQFSFHKEAINKLNHATEIGRSLGINIIYISHVHTNLIESKIYNEVNIYATNTIVNNRMLSNNLGFTKEVINEIDNFLQTDPYIIYNKIFDTFMTDKRIYKLK